jgi:hypothetical protein
MSQICYTARSDTDAVVQDWDGAIIGPEHQAEWAAYQAWLADGHAPSPPIPEPAYIPAVISDRQFFQMAAIDGLVSMDEALAAVKTGAIPPVLQTIVDGIDDPFQQFAAKMLLSGATEFERNHPLTEAVGAHLGWTSAQIDQFFIQGAKL